MGTRGVGSSTGVPVGLPLAEAYNLLDAKRIDVDRRMTSLTPDDPAREELWQELEAVLEKLREVVSKLAKSSAADLLELQAKSTILASLLRPGDYGTGPTIAEPERVALTLSLTEDIARLPNS